MIRANEGALPDTPDTFDLARLKFANAVTVGQALRRCNAGATCEDQVAQRVAEYLFETFRDPLTGEPNCVLVRCFQTHPYDDLPEGAQEAARRIDVRSRCVAGLRCLALLGTRGVNETWNRVEDSVAHRAIPLVDVGMVERAPMIARLVEQMGLEARHIAEPRTALLMNTSQYRNFGVFHVETALGSEYLPAQQTFVEEYGIRSVVGMGGLLPSGEFFAVILFSRVVIAPEVAALFRTLALSVKLALLPYAPDDVFSVFSERTA